mgnify:CR=1 FL=1
MDVHVWWVASRLLPGMCMCSGCQVVHRGLDGLAGLVCGDGVLTLQGSGPCSK